MRDLLVAWTEHLYRDAQVGAFDQIRIAVGAVVVAAVRAVELAKAPIRLYEGVQRKVELIDHAALERHSAVVVTQRRRGIGVPNSTVDLKSVTRTAGKLIVKGVVLGVPVAKLVFHCHLEDKVASRKAGSCAFDLGGELLAVGDDNSGIELIRVATGGAGAIVIAYITARAAEAPGAITKLTELAVAIVVLVALIRAYPISRTIARSAVVIVLAIEHRINSEVRVVVLNDPVVMQQVLVQVAAVEKRVHGRIIICKLNV